MTLDLTDLQQRLRAFAAARQWQPYHTPKNLAMALMVEAAELQELFQWLTPEESQQLTADPAQKERVGEEMADVLWVLICLANQTGIDLTAELEKSFEKKTRRDATRHINNSKL